MAHDHSGGGPGGSCDPHTLLQMEPAPAAEQQTVVQLSAPRATLQLRFPIADLRPERDPWAGRAVRAEQLRLELSEPQFKSELSSGPGPPAPTRLELTCSDLHGETHPPRETAPGRESGLWAGEVGLRLRKRWVTVGADPGPGFSSSVGHQHCLSLPHLGQSGPFIPGLLQAVGMREGTGL